MRKAIIFLMALMLVSAVSAFNIETPDHKTYDDNIVNLTIIHDEELDYIRYSVDDSSIKEICDDCKIASVLMELEDGQHIIRAYGREGDNYYEDDVVFSIKLENESFSLVVESPVDKRYDTGGVSIIIRANATLDEIDVRIDSIYHEECEDCQTFSDIVELEAGSYSLRARGYLDDDMREVVVHFTVGNVTYQNRTGIRFDQGFEKLPQMYETGEISDDELQEILKENQLNPGVLNRLIMTRMLSNETLEIILDYQEFKPQGILNKVLYWFGYRGNTYAANIAKNYNLSEKIQQRLVTRDDIPDDIQKKLQNELRNRIRSRVSQGQGQMIRAEITVEVATQGNVTNLPPGQMKKQENNQISGRMVDRSAELSKGTGDGDRGSVKGNSNSRG